MAAETGSSTPIQQNLLKDPSVSQFYTFPIFRIYLPKDSVIFHSLSATSKRPKFIFGTKILSSFLVSSSELLAKLIILFLFLYPMSYVPRYVIESNSVIAL